MADAIGEAVMRYASALAERESVRSSSWCAGDQREGRGLAGGTAHRAREPAIYATPAPDADEVGADPRSSRSSIGERGDSSRLRRSR